ncbi:hypothetical protein PCIT_a3555 [Pseudoalteromonas citrea]|uniref:Uncharacterized protein n=1 Tax=Pseudoalteromonas citrea TaxID=43655 RepID=A0AAD4AH40_9GAMM|nr:hypothetical protein PCIT_a3555 [Pseudoalteromonas citrea]
MPTAVKSLLFWSILVVCSILARVGCFSFNLGGIKVDGQ